MALSTLRCASASALAVVLQSERSAYAAGAAGDAHLSRNGDGGICVVSTRQPVSVRVGNRSGKELWSLVDGRRGKKKSVTRAVAVVSGSGSLEMAAALFTFATAFVMPMYTVMIVAPKWEWTKKAVESSLPFAVLGALYMYLFALSWTPETMQLMFASKYWLPELAGITRMFSSTTTVASAWVHLLAADLFAGRQVFLDGLKNDVETRHSLVLCLMMCPIGILCHIVTKFVTLFLRRKDQGRQEAFNVR